MRACASLLLALVIACGGDGDDDNANGTGGSGSGGSPSSVGSVDCSEYGENQPLACNAPEVCCALPSTVNDCATSCTTTLVLRCDDDGDCSGGSCCWNRMGTTGSECQSSCESGFAPVCTRSIDCPSNLPCCLGAVYNGIMARFCTEQQATACL